MTRSNILLSENQLEKELLKLVKPVQEWLKANGTDEMYVAINTESMDLGEALLSINFEDKE